MIDQKKITKGDRIAATLLVVLIIFMVVFTISLFTAAFTFYPFITILSLIVLYLIYKYLPDAWVRLL